MRALIVRVRTDACTESEDNQKVVHFISVVDPDPGSGAFLMPGSGMDKKQNLDPG